MHTPQSLADVLERDYFPRPSGSTKPSAERYGAKLYLTDHEWRMVIAALRASPPEAEELAQLCDEVGASDYQKVNATHGERLAWCHGAVACADAIRARCNRSEGSK
jgi:hypothetical protein